MLKKIILTIAMVAFTANAYAVTLKITAVAGITFVPSKNVTLGYEGGNLSGNSNVVYTIGSKNTAGDKIYGATNASSAIGFKSGTPGTALAVTDGPAMPTTISDSALVGYSVL